VDTSFSKKIYFTSYRSIILEVNFGGSLLYYNLLNSPYVVVIITFTPITQTLTN